MKKTRNLQTEIQHVKELLSQDELKNFPLMTEKGFSLGLPTSLFLPVTVND